MNVTYGSLRHLPPPHDEKPTVRGVVTAAILTCVLASCGTSSVVSDMPVFAATSAVRWAAFLLNGGGMESRPSALLGTYAVTYLAQGRSMARTALVGAQSQIDLFFEGTRQENESYQLLQDFGNALAVDIPDMLNRSPDRALALNQYVDALGTYQAAAQRQLEALEGTYDQSQEERREKRRDLTDLERRENTAIREKDYVTAGSLQNAISDAEQELAEIDAKERQLRDVIDIYEDVLEAAETRQTAIASNREVLIAGVKIIDVPGIADIGIVQGDGTRLRYSNGGAFGGL